MIFNHFCVLFTKYVTIFVCLILRSSSTSKQSHQYHSKIDTTTQDQLPRAASELKCSLASSSKPILQPPQMIKTGNRESNSKSNRQDEYEMNGKCGLNKKSHFSRENKKEEKDKGCGNVEEKRCGRSKNPKPSTTVQNNTHKIKRNCRRWNNIFGQVICTTWRFTLVDRIGPYVSLPNIPSPNGNLRQHPNQPHAMVEVTEFQCGPPFAREFGSPPTSHNHKDSNQNQRPPQLVHDEQTLLGSSYHRLELNFLFSGQKK